MNNNQDSSDNSSVTGQDEIVSPDDIFKDEAQIAAEAAAEPVVEEAKETESPVGVESQSASTEEQAPAEEVKESSGEGEPSELESKSTEESPTAESSEDEEIERVRDDLDWYVVNAYSGFELKAKIALEERIKIHGLEDKFGAVRVPQETVVELVKGEKKTSNRKFFPGYILVQMEMNQDTWHLVKETPKISGFVGDASDPQPIPLDEVRRILSQVEEGASSPRSRVSFDQGETVKVVDGPFADFNGTIEEVKPEKGKVRVLISIFGRATPVELDFIQVEKC